MSFCVGAVALRSVSIRTIARASLLACLAACGGDGATGTATPLSLSLATVAAGAASSAPFRTQPVIEVRNASGDVIAGDDRTVVTMTVSAGGSTVGIDYARAARGLVTFTNAGLKGPAGSYTLTFSTPRATSVTQAADLPPVRFSSVSAGNDHTCALAAGTAYCWGENGLGQLGTGAPASSLTPTGVRFVREFQLVAAGDYHSCGLDVNGAAFCWGDNLNGQLGDGTRLARQSPVAVLGGLTFTTLVTGAANSCALTAAGAAYCWGGSQYGQSGDGAEYQTTPLALGGGHVFTSLSSGSVHVCGITSSGAAFCWGYGRVGELGSGMNNSAVPLAVQGGLVFAQLAAGENYTCGLAIGGAAYCWGNNYAGELGDGTLGNPRSNPMPVLGNYVFASLTSGGGHTCGLTAAGVGYCWGWNLYGQLGDGSGSNQWTPVAIAGGSTFIALEGGEAHTCGVLADFSLQCWGWNAAGQLGTGGRSDAYRPVAVPSP